VWGTCSFFHLASLKLILFFLFSLFSLSHSQRLNEKFDEKINAGIDQLINEVPEPPPNAPLPPSGA
jgi:hypothetical protein